MTTDDLRNGNASESLAVERIDSEKAFFDLKEEWNDLLSSSKSNTIFLTWEWMQAWWKCFRAEERPWLVVVKEASGRTVGIAPFCLTLEPGVGGLPIKCLRFLADRSAGSEYLDFIVRQGDEEKILNAIFKYLGDQHSFWDIIRLKLIPADSPTLPLLANWARHTSQTLRKEPAVCSAIPLPKSWDSYLQTLQPRFRTSLRSKTRNLAQGHKVKVFQSLDVAQLPAHLEAMFKLHQARWEQAGKPGSFRSAPKRQFYQTIAERFSEKGWLRFYLLMVDGEILAAQFGFAYNRILFHLQEGTCLTNPTWSVGNVLRAHVVREIIDEGFTEYDFLGGVTFHKKNWGALPKYACNVVVSKRSVIPFLSTSIPYWKKRARTAIKSLLVHNGVRRASKV